MWRVRLDVAPLLLFESPCFASDWPGPVDLYPSGLRARPDLLRNDSQRLVLDDMPLVIWLGDTALPSCSRVAAGFSAIPGPAADIPLVLQDAAKGGWCPALHRELKLHCVRADVSVMAFVVQALEEKLARESGAKTGRRRAR
jgi:hypothetical protein